MEAVVVEFLLAGALALLIFLCLFGPNSSIGSNYR